MIVDPSTEQWKLVMILLFIAIALLAATVNGAAKVTTLRQPAKVIQIPDVTASMKHALYETPETLGSNSILNAGQEVAIRTRSDGLLIGRVDSWKSRSCLILIGYGDVLPPDSYVAVSWDDTILLGEIEYCVGYPAAKPQHKQSRITIKVHHAIYGVSRFRNELRWLGLVRSDLYRSA